MREDALRPALPGTCLVRTEACLTKPWGAAPAPPNLPGLARAPEAQAWPEMVRQAGWNAVPRRAPGKPPKVSLPEPRLLPGARWAWGGPSLLGSSALSEGQGLESHMRAGSWGGGAGNGRQEGCEQGQESPAQGSPLADGGRGRGAPVPGPGPWTRERKCRTRPRSGVQPHADPTPASCSLEPWWTCGPLRCPPTGLGAWEAWLSGRQ